MSVWPHLGWMEGWGEWAGCVCWGHCTWTGPFSSSLHLDVWSQPLAWGLSHGDTRRSRTAPAGSRSSDRRIFGEVGSGTVRGLGVAIRPFYMWICRHRTLGEKSSLLIFTTRSAVGEMLPHWSPYLDPLEADGMGAWVELCRFSSWPFGM